MILHPTAQEFTVAKGVNRYTAVIAAAKGARYLVSKHNRERDEAELAKESASVPGKDVKFETVPYRDDVRAVSTAVQKIIDGEYKIILTDETPTV